MDDLKVAKDLERATPDTIGGVIERLGSVVDAVCRAVDPDNEVTIEAAEQLYGGPLAVAQRVVHELLDEHIADAHKLHRGLTEKRRKLLQPIEGYAQRVIESARAARRELALREQAAIEEEARAKREEVEQRAAEAAALARKRGEKDLAQEIEQRIESLPPPVVAPLPLRAGAGTGVTYPDTWRAEVVSLKQLCRAVADGQVPEDLVEANMTRLNAMAKALKDTAAIPGVRVTKDSAMRRVGARSL